MSVLRVADWHVSGGGHVASASQVLYSVPVNKHAISHSQLLGSFFCRCWLSGEHSVMGILPGVFGVMAAPHHWPYGHNQTRANVPAVSCIICFATPRIPDGCDLEAKIWQKGLTSTNCCSEMWFTNLTLVISEGRRFHSVTDVSSPHRNELN